MADMLVKLYDIPKPRRKLDIPGIEIRRAMAYEKSAVRVWVRDHFSRGWADECEISFTRQPVSIFLAIERGELAGFACYNATYKNFFGPTGVRDESRGKGLGEVLLLESLKAMRDEGYAYAIIGGVGPAEFYKRAAGAVMIEGSEPGAYPAAIV